nr:MAG TPA: Endodeoxyribonuclease RusA [Caudoviricetes sp.]
MTCSEGLVFQVPGEPVGKGRPRFTRQGRAYTPAKTAKYENLVSLAFQQMYPNHVPFENAVEMKMIAYFSIPKSWSKKKHQQAVLNQIFPTKKPDTDNIAKVKDALNGIAFKDDSQVVKETIIKRYAEIPKLIIYIKEV